MSSPLLETHELPPFNRINAKDIPDAIKEITDTNLAAIDTLLQDASSPSWASLVLPLEALNDRLEQAWSPVSHLNGVLQTDELRLSYEACLPVLSNYSTQIGQNKALYQAYKTLHDSTEFTTLDSAQQQVIRNNLRDFKLAGIALPDAQQKRYAKLKTRLSEASNQFSNNVLDATQAWSKHFADNKGLEGLPKTALNAAKAAAANKNQEGFLLTLDAPCYLAVMSYANKQVLRKEMYLAYATRASDQGPNADEFNNSELMTEITRLRHELATLLEFNNYAEYSLAKKMASSCEQVTGFLHELGARSRDGAKKELTTLTQFAAADLGNEPLQSWDVAYYSEKLRQEKYNLDQEQLRPYFPANKVIDGLFSITGKLFDIDIQADTSMESWHEDVTTYRISRQGNTIARFYLDLYARENKRGGAWMAGCRERRKIGDSIQNPVAFLTCNFMAPAGEQPSLLTFNEVTTLFHEFGHGLHHMLSQIEYAEVSGINGVAWDAVELPSQFLENWCWQAETITELSAHYQTGEALPTTMLDKLLAAKNFQSGMQMLRQLEFALFDFEMHQQPGMHDAAKIQSILDAVRKEIAVLIPPTENRFQHGFSHIFAGGYAAGYYSYKWAEVLSADAFSVFEKNGIYDDKTRKRFLHEILEKGGSADAMVLFQNFMGREPNIEALLRHSGI